MAFTNEDSDPIKDMGIIIKQTMKEFALDLYFSELTKVITKTNVDASKAGEILDTIADYYVKDQIEYGDMKTLTDCDTVSELRKEFAEKMEPVDELICELVDEAMHTYFYDKIVPEIKAGDTSYIDYVDTEEEIKAEIERFKNEESVDECFTEYCENFDCIAFDNLIAEFMNDSMNNFMDKNRNKILKYGMKYQQKEILDILANVDDSDLFN